MRDLREASIGELLKELSEQTSTLIRQELQLARVVYGAGAAIIAMSGKKKIEAALPLAPQTTETLKEDVQWAKTRAISAQR